MRARSIGPMTVLMRVWPVLKSLPLMGTRFSMRELALERGDVDREVRGAVRERHAFQDRGVGVEHRRGDRGVVGVDRRFERLDRLVRRPGSMKISVLAAQIMTTRSTCFSP
jgi:hypothetical protein